MTTLESTRAGSRNLFSPFSDTAVLTRRNLLHVRSDPAQLIAITVQPLVFLLLFVSVFGGAVSGSSRAYLQFALPGFLVQAAVFTGMQTAVGLSSDFQQGLIGRFRAMPMSGWAVVASRIVADVVRMAFGAAIVLGAGVLFGFRFHGGPGAAVGALLLVLLFGFAMCWPMALLGITARSAESAQEFAFLIVLPVTFLTSMFVAPELMPAWLRAVANANPVTAAVDAVRGLMLGRPVGGAVTATVAWAAAITVVFSALVVLRYRRQA
ncbi:ABC transporter permease [Actinoplanes sp. N902-109]|uniref:ABC transporter permease n=1 Tax=Actinoplanes sp. (strain N902-109) TaxID=649831 RepID=UPI0003295C98|nr:ABC transporter permease [Actinoplanes sp. N902-109]AGL16630.1 ABC transporter [Actinoplanes sp. N902-109]